MTIPALAAQQWLGVEGVSRHSVHHIPVLVEAEGEQGPPELTRWSVAY